LAAGCARRLPRVSPTQITLINGDRHEVGGEPADVEKAIVAAARGSILQLAWLEEAASGRALAVNPAHVVSIRAADA
jgi:hypothetical protein